MANAEDLFQNIDGTIVARLRTMPVDIGYGRTRQLYDLILGWASHVDKLRQEQGSDQSANPVSWNEHDYVAALFIRDFVEKGLSGLDDLLVQAVSGLISKIDMEYMSFTQSGHRIVLSRVANVDTDARGWWWDRIPQSGPILDRLNRFY